MKKINNKTKKNYTKIENENSAIQYKLMNKRKVYFKNK